MTRVTLDAELRKRFSFSQPVEFCDDSGKVVGRYFPVCDASQSESLKPQVSDEELRRRSKSDKWFTTEQVLEHLKSLESQ